MISNDYYLCLGLNLNETNKTLIDERNQNLLLDINRIDDKILILEREVTYWLLHPMKTLIEEDIMDLENGYSYVPFKNSIFMLFGIFAYIDKIEQYRAISVVRNTNEDDNNKFRNIICRLFKCKKISRNSSNTKLIIHGLKRIFNHELNNVSNAKLNKIVKHTRHKLMHGGMIGDDVLLNLKFPKPIEYIYNNHTSSELRINPIEIFNKVSNDFTAYIEELQLGANQDLCDSFSAHFQKVYKKEIEILN